MITATEPTSLPGALPRPDRWHRSLLLVAALMIALTGVTIVLAIVDPREVLGQNAWFKPMKFAISITLYSVTIAWLIGMLRRWRRTADVLGTVIAVALLVEIVIIVAAAATGDTSHFNVSDPSRVALWSIMAASISIAWVANMVLGVAVILNPGADAARNLAVRAGVILGLIGMGLAFLMVGPTEDQLNDFQGISGAHAVGISDGGPGIPFFGWSTEGGDLRIPHFIGMHALQVIPLGLLALELLSRRVAVLRDARVRWELVAIGTATYAAFIAIVTWQAVAGESIIAPSAAVLGASVGTVVAALGAAAIVLGRRHRRGVRARSGG